MESANCDGYGPSQFTVPFACERLMVESLAEGIASKAADEGKRALDHAGKPQELGLVIFDCTLAVVRLPLCALGTDWNQGPGGERRAPYGESQVILRIKEDRVTVRCKELASNFVKNRVTYLINGYVKACRGEQVSWSSATKSVAGTMRYPPWAQGNDNGPLRTASNEANDTDEWSKQELRFAQMWLETVAEKGIEHPRMALRLLHGAAAAVGANVPPSIEEGLETAQEEIETAAKAQEAPEEEGDEEFSLVEEHASEAWFPGSVLDPSSGFSGRGRGSHRGGYGSGGQRPPRTP